MVVGLPDGGRVGVTVTARPCLSKGFQDSGRPCKSPNDFGVRCDRPLAYRSVVAWAAAKGTPKHHQHTATMEFPDNPMIIVPASLTTVGAVGAMVGNDRVAADNCRCTTVSVRSIEEPGGPGDHPTQAKYG
jgi:hypothetical protein